MGGAYGPFVHAKSLQSCPTLCDPVDYSLPGFSVHGTLQARIVEWVAMPSSRGSSQPRDQTQVSYISYIDRWVFFTTSATWEVLGPIKKFQIAMLAESLVVEPTDSHKVKEKLESIKYWCNSKWKRSEGLPSKSDLFSQYVTGWSVSLQNPCVEVLTQNVTSTGDRVFLEGVKWKWGHMGGLCSCMTGALIRVEMWL